MNIVENLNSLFKEVPEKIKVVAISKTKPVENIMEIYQSGHKIFGENKAQELIAKQPELPADIEWHFVGHLQRNKAKYLVPFVSLIHSVDSLKLLKEINKQAIKVERTIDCLLQFHIASEETKFGLDLQEAKALLESDQFKLMNNIRICGVMGMATFTDNKEKIREEFKSLNNTFNTLKAEYFPNDQSFREISMGMSNDYRIAIEEGSTMLRLGTTIFGERNYN